jgi:formiminoglutamase
MLEDYLTKITLGSEYKPYQLGANVSYYGDTFPNLSSKKIAVLGVASHPNQIQACDTIRQAFYNLVAHKDLENSIVDIGNLQQGNTPADTHAALLYIATHLKKKGLTTIVLGTNLNQGEALFKCYTNFDETTELSLISAQLPLLEYQLLHRICTEYSDHLATLNVLAFQAPLIPSKAIDTLQNMNFGHYRLGAIKTNMEDAELYLRNAGVTLFDINAIKHSDAPGKQASQPNGLSSEEACQLARYAGLSDVSEFLGLFDYLPENDTQYVTAKLIAQIMWYYMDGYTSRKKDLPTLHDEFLKYRCDLKDNQPPVLFLKSKRTNRWWMHLDKHYVPCSYNDYQKAASGELSERYLDALKKLH